MSEKPKVFLLFDRLDNNRKTRRNLQIIVWVLVFSLSIIINSYWYVNPITVIVVWSLVGIVATFAIGYYYNIKEIQLLREITRLTKSKQDEETESKPK